MMKRKLKNSVKKIKNRKWNIIWDQLYANVYANQPGAYHIIDKTRSLIIKDRLYLILEDYMYDIIDKEIL